MGSQGPWEKFMAHPHKKKMIFAVSMVIILAGSFALHSIASDADLVNPRLVVVVGDQGWQEQSTPMSGFNGLDGIIHSGGAVSWAFGSVGMTQSKEMAVNTTGAATEWQYVPYPDNALPSQNMPENFTPAYPETGAGTMGWAILNTGISYFDGSVFGPVSHVFSGRGAVNIYASQGSAWGVQPALDGSSTMVSVFNASTKSWTLSHQVIPALIYSAAADGASKVLYVLGSDSNLYGVDAQGNVRKITSFPVSASSSQSSLVLAQGNTVFVIINDDNSINAFYFYGGRWITVAPLAVSNLMGLLNSVEMMNGIVSMPDTGNDTWAFLDLTQSLGLSAWTSVAYPSGISSANGVLLYSNFSSDGHQRCVAVASGAPLVACYDFALGQWLDVASFSSGSIIPTVFSLSNVVALGGNQVIALGQDPDFDSLLLYYNNGTWFVPKQTVPEGVKFSIDASYFNSGNVWASWVPGL